MRNALTTLMMLGTVMFLAVPVVADWDPGDGHQMHFPQLPDETGWDINMTTIVDYPPPTPLADDFLCTETGPITGIHLWASVRDGDDTRPFQMDHIEVRIRADIPAAISPTGYSMPGQELWYWEPDQTWPQVDIYPETLEGWWDPLSGRVVPEDHSRYHQYNFEIPEAEAYVQEEGTIYWLDVAFTSYLNQILFTGPVGWKTSQDHWNDVAVYWDPANAQWMRLFDPVTTERLDLAFVITPEPSTLLLVTFGLLGLLAYPWRRCLAR